jgi:GTP cyclohydrolase I
MIEEDNGIDYIGAATDVLSFAAGLDTTTPHGRDTPRRFLEMLQEMTTPEEFKFTTFPADRIDEMIVELDIPFVSLCNHHVVPFIGVAHIAYVPDKEMAGLSKLPRTVHYFAASLNMQEGLTDDVAQFLHDRLQPKGVAVVMEAEHLCMTIRGVKSPGTKTRTAKMMGVFADHKRTAKSEFLSAINSPRR